MWHVKLCKIKVISNNEPFIEVKLFWIGTKNKHQGRNGILLNT